MPNQDQPYDNQPQNKQSEGNGEGGAYFYNRQIVIDRNIVTEATVINSFEIHVEAAIGVESHADFISAVAEADLETALQKFGDLDTTGGGFGDVCRQLLANLIANPATALESKWTIGMHISTRTEAGGPAREPRLVASMRINMPLAEMKTSANKYIDQATHISYWRGVDYKKMKDAVAYWADQNPSRYPELSIPLG